jgi:hypothetical protein
MCLYVSLYVSLYVCLSVFKWLFTHIVIVFNRFQVPRGPFRHSKRVNRLVYCSKPTPLTVLLGMLNWVAKKLFRIPSLLYSFLLFFFSLLFSPFHSLITLIYPVRLRNVHPEGGLIPQVDVIIQRVYPKVYMETVKGEDDVEVRVTRSERDEEMEAKANEVSKFF